MLSVANCGSLAVVQTQREAEEIFHEGGRTSEKKCRTCKKKKKKMMMMMMMMSQRRECVDEPTTTEPTPTNRGGKRRPTGPTPTAIHGAVARPSGLAAAGVCGSLFEVEDDCEDADPGESFLARPSKRKLRGLLMAGRGPVRERR